MSRERSSTASEPLPAEDLPITDLNELRRVAMVCLVLAVVVGAISVLLGLAALDWDVEALVFGDPETTLEAGRDGALLWRWSMVLDVFYSYLLLVPLALYGHRRLRERKPWLADLALVGALMYITLGAAAAAILAIAGSALIEAYAGAQAAERTAIQTSFRTLRDALYFGVWQMLDAITAGTWVLSSGVLLMSDRPGLGRLLMTLGSGLWLFAFLTMLGVHSLVVLAVMCAGVVVLWLIWLGVDRRRKSAARHR